ncbi:MAG: hypothetical protein K6F94_02885 [Bacteroidaceae bacterium]|nr:hypothetical protein [Bacteroidaceae bacterium]
MVNGWLARGGRWKMEDGRTCGQGPRFEWFKRFEGFKGLGWRDEDEER